MSHGFMSSGHSDRRSAVSGSEFFKTMHLCSDRRISGNNAFKFQLKKRSASAECREGLKYYAFLPAIVHFKNNARFLPRSVFPQNEDRNRFVCVRLYLDIAS